MRYTKIADRQFRDEFRDFIPQLTAGLWLLDFSPERDSLISGPFLSIREAHDQREWLWDYGEEFGKYSWLLNERGKNILQSLQDDILGLQLSVDTVTLEVVTMRIATDRSSEWIYIPKRQKSPRKA